MSLRALLNPAFLAALIAMAGAAIAMDAGIRAYGIYLRKLPIDPPKGRVLGAIPPETKHWRRIGGDENVDADTLDVLGTGNYLTRLYTRKNTEGDKPPPVVQFHAAYYTGMIDTVPHVPDRCFVAGGMALSGGPWELDIPLNLDWTPHPNATPEEAGRVYSVRLDDVWSAAPGQRVRLPRDLTPEQPLKLRVTEYSFPGGGRMYAGYFFVANGGWVSSANGVRQLAFNLTDDYSYYLKVQFSSTGAGSPGELALLAGSLLDDLLGEIMRCVPDWTEVQNGRYPDDNPRRDRSGTGARP
jgi:hypothetical protein